MQDLTPTFSCKNIVIHYSQPEHPVSAYHQQINTVRQIILQVLGLRPLPVATRLFLCCLLTDKISGAIHSRADRIDPNLLTREVDRFAAPGVIDELHQQYEASAPPLNFSMSVIQSIVLERITHTNECTQLLLTILQNYGLATERSGTTLTFKTKGDSLAESFTMIALSYQQRREQLQKTFGPRLDIYFENYARNFWFRDLFVRSPSPLANMRDLLLRLAIVKFLLFSHPGLNDLVNDEVTSPQAEATLDTVAVDTFYRFSRGVEHSAKLLPQINTAMEQQQLTSLAHLVLLSKF